MEKEIDILRLIFVHEWHENLLESTFVPLVLKSKKICYCCCYHLL